MTDEEDSTDEESDDDDETKIEVDPVQNLRDFVDLVRAGEYRELTQDDAQKVFRVGELTIPMSDVTVERGQNTKVHFMVLGEGDPVMMVNQGRVQIAEEGKWKQVTMKSQATIPFFISI